jgi:hypothetical protein
MGNWLLILTAPKPNERKITMSLKKDRPNYTAMDLAREVKRLLREDQLTAFIPLLREAPHADMYDLVEVMAHGNAPTPEHAPEFANLICVAPKIKELMADQYHALADVLFQTDDKALTIFFTLAELADDALDAIRNEPPAK